jgi:hypothetical protein
VHSTAQHPTVHAQNCLLFAIKTRQQQIERLIQPINQSECAITLFTPGHTFYTAASERSVRCKSPAAVTTTQTHCCTTSKLVGVVGGSTGFLQAAEELYIKCAVEKSSFQHKHWIHSRALEPTLFALRFEKFTTISTIHTFFTQVVLAVSAEKQSCHFKSMHVHQHLRNKNSVTTFAVLCLPIVLKNAPLQ